MEAEAGDGPWGGRTGCGPSLERVAQGLGVLAREWGGGGRGARHGRPVWGRGRGPFGGAGPFGAGFGGWGGFRGGPRARRGDVRAAALLLLAEEPRNGYQIMQAIAERSGGVWQPSPGSVYPALQQLEDEGLIAAAEAAGQRRFQLSDAGRAYVEAHREQLGTPWEAAADSVGDDVHALLHLARQNGAALLQIAHSGTPSQIARAAEILQETRRALYRVLAEDAPPDRAQTGPSPTPGAP